ncbi:type II secretion system F family protein [Paludicola sp. MB14-C6]|uniref:type II secretion system F family protein n=1 Tax=Paludihabitans sp. MB14-C6 TaxID=3070656 RepID=UPI0027DE40B3|nr:type II secretion system F family protein [Paludicola sp. MB14-C6]WMJ22095.1 type II secretion system F family protein [Paludicola sp. MB14-C6]
MVEYKYKAKDFSGKNQIGTIHAENLNDFYVKLHEKNLFCISVKETPYNSDTTVAISATSYKNKIGVKDISIFCRQFATMLNSGLTVVKCLDILYRQAERRKIKTVLLNLYESIKKGNSLSAAMKEQDKSFPQLLISMVESGEASGTLDDVMLAMSSHYEKEKALKHKITTAMIYPIVLIIVSIISVTIIMVKVVPTFISLFGSRTNLPSPTKILLSISSFMTHCWYILFIAVVGISIGWIFLLKIESVRLAFDKFKINVPVFGKLTLIVATARFSRTVAALYIGGVPIIESIKISANVVGNQYIIQKLHSVIDEIKQGVPFSKALINANVFPTMFSSMVFIGEESGSLDDILLKTANFYDEDAQSAMTKMVALLEPIMILILAVIIGFIVIAIAVPMFGMYSNIA